MTRLPSLPMLLGRKIYKTGQTRGADDDEIFQNRVGRNSTVLIPFSQYSSYVELLNSGFRFENGFIVLISPDEYFSEGFEEKMTTYGLKLGVNALVFYELRHQWIEHNPTSVGWRAANNRQDPLGGEYIARISATTSVTDGKKIVEGFSTTAGKGAGIRVYEYSSNENTNLCRVQLEAEYWFCEDSLSVAIANGMTEEAAQNRKTNIINQANALNLLDKDKLVDVRIIDEAGYTVCPLCLERLSAVGFFAKMEQALGREVHDLTVTQLSLFHITELRTGVFNHKPYNLGWGHHHCNVVAKDSGIAAIVHWMEDVVERNHEHETKHGELTDLENRV